MEQNESRPNQLFARQSFSFLKTCKTRNTYEEETLRQKGTCHFSEM